MGVGQVWRLVGMGYVVMWQTVKHLYKEAHKTVLLEEGDTIVWVESSSIYILHYDKWSFSIHAMDTNTRELIKYILHHTTINNAKN